MPKLRVNLECLRCGHKWQRRGYLAHLPKSCPKCKTYEWQTDVKQEV